MSNTPGEAPASRLEAIKAERDTFAALAFCWADVVMVLDGDGTIRFACGATRFYLGMRETELTGRNFDDFAVPEDAGRVAAVLAESRGRGRVERDRVRLQGNADRATAMTLVGYSFDPNEGQFFLALRGAPATATETAAHAAEEAESGLLAPDVFAARAAQRARAAEAAGDQVAVTLLEMPGLERTAETLGAADRMKLRRRIGETVRAQALDSDTAAYVGEGKYSLLHGAAADMGSLENALARIAREADPQGRTAGVATTRVDVERAGQLAETDLVRGLTYMLNQFSHAPPGAAELPDTVSALVDRARGEVGAFRQTISDGAFQIVLQPILAARTGAIHHFEALSRFEDGGSPGQRIRFAEETGMIHEFDLAMVREVLAWLRGQPREMPGLKVAVNVSGNSVGRAEYVDALLELLDANTWARGRLLFEITESARMSDLAGANRFIQRVRQRGYTVCLDDLGAGAASFRYLSALDVDYVKIDGHALHHARQAAKGTAFLSALVELCQRLGTHTIAEMIDDAEALAFVYGCGVDYVQGFLFGRPSPKLRDFSPLPNATLFQRFAGR